MSTVLIRYHLRLGDIIRLFPIAQHYAQQGRRVLIECNPEYHSIFETVSYVDPVNPGANIAGAEVFDPQIWPVRYQHFRASGMGQMDYVWSLYPEWKDIPRKIEFDLMDFGAGWMQEHYDLPAEYSLLFPFCYSSTQFPIERILEIGGEVLQLSPPAFLFMAPEQMAWMRARGFKPDERLRTVTSLAHFPQLIRDAKEVVTVNTSTTIIASAVREHYFHIKEPNPQDNWDSPNQTVLVP